VFGLFGKQPKIETGRQVAQRAYASILRLDALMKSLLGNKHSVFSRGQHCSALAGFINASSDDLARHGDRWFINAMNEAINIEEGCIRGLYFLPAKECAELHLNRVGPVPLPRCHVLPRKPRRDDVFALLANRGDATDRIYQWNSSISGKDAVQLYDLGLKRDLRKAAEAEYALWLNLPEVYPPQNFHADLESLLGDNTPIQVLRDFPEGTTFAIFVSLRGLYIRDALKCLGQLQRIGDSDMADPAVARILDDRESLIHGWQQKASETNARVATLLKEIEGRSKQLAEIDQDRRVQTKRQALARQQEEKESADREAKGQHFEYECRILWQKMLEDINGRCDRLRHNGTVDNRSLKGAMRKVIRTAATACMDRHVVVLRQYIESLAVAQPSQTLAQLEFQLREKMDIERFIDEEAERQVNKGKKTKKQLREELDRDLAEIDADHRADEDEKEFRREKRETKYRRAMAELESHEDE